MTACTLYIIVYTMYIYIHMSLDWSHLVHCCIMTPNHGLETGEGEGEGEGESGGNKIIIIIIDLD